MREIKFRGKDLRRDEWVYGFFIQFGDKYFIVEYGKPGIPAQQIEVDPKTVGQFIGFKDKNGKEIFEGDIVEWKTYACRCFKNYENRMEVSFKLTGGGAYQTVPFINEDTEVIGNIYENKNII